MNSLIVNRAVSRCASAILKHNTAVLAPAALAMRMTMMMASPASAQAASDAKPQRYRLVALPLSGAAGSYLGGYLNFGPLTNRGTIGYITAIRLITRRIPGPAAAKPRCRRFRPAPIGRATAPT